MNDTEAKKNAERIRRDFWSTFDHALAPKNASKRAYLEELEELSADVEGRIDAVRDELRDEGDEE